KLGGIGPGNPYYDPKAWAPVTEVRFGNTGRNTVRGPGWGNLDLSLFRKFPISKVNLEARIEAFNVTNTPHFGGPEHNPTNDDGEAGVRLGSSRGRAHLLPEHRLRLAEPAEPPEHVGPEVVQPGRRSDPLLDGPRARLLEHRERLRQLRPRPMDLRQHHRALG